MELKVRGNAVLSAIVAFTVILSNQNCGSLKSSPFNSDSNSSSSLQNPEPNHFTCTTSSPPPVSTEMKRLTHQELGLVLTDIFGSTLVNEVSAKIDLYPLDILTDPDETYTRNPTKEHVSAAFYLADALGEALAKNRTPLVNFAGSCISTPSPNKECVTGLIQNLGMKVFRRPLTKGSASSEVEKLSATYTDEGSSVEGLRVLITQMMLSPEFWFHFEGTGAVAGKNVTLTPYEVASRISFTVTGSLPDAELFAAAQSNQLSNLTQIQEHVRRLMQTQKAKSQILNFFVNWLLINGSTELSQNPNFLNGINSNGLADEMAIEMKKFIEYVVFVKKGSLSDLFMDPSLFAKSARLANIYQAPRWVDGQAPTQSSGPYKGIILRGNLMLTQGESTSPILRGVFLRKRILCETLPSPSGDLVAKRDDIDPDPLKYSNRIRTHLKTDSPLCISCHSRINPIGFVLENFDSIGRWRNVESVFSNGTVVAQHTIDTNVVIDDVSSDRSLSTTSPEDLNKELSESDNVSGCFSRRYFRQLNLRRENLNKVADNCRLYDMQSKLNGSTLLDFFVESVANKNIFYRPL